jgi:hypothetical protein
MQTVLSFPCSVSVLCARTFRVRSSMFLFAVTDGLKGHGLRVGLLGVLFPATKWPMREDERPLNASAICFLVTTSRYSFRIPSDLCRALAAVKRLAEGDLEA